MKNKTHKKILFLCLLGVSTLLTHVHASVLAQTDTPATSVIAAQYADFLNHVAVIDPDHLYDDAMGSDPEIACIVRIGAPGQWHYEVIAGRENFPITYVGKISEAQYSNWLQQGSISCESSELSLKSNLSGFEVDVTSLSSLTLALASTPTSHLLSSISYSNSYWKDAAIAVFSIGCMMMTPGEAVAVDRADAESTEQDTTAQNVNPNRNNAALSLEHFQSAAQAHPDASRLILRKDGASSSLVPQEESQDILNINNNRKENSAAHQALRDALTSHYPSEIVDEALPLNHNPLSNPTLSGERLRNILEKAASEKTKWKSSIAESLTELTQRTLVDQDALYNEANNHWNVSELAWESRSVAAHNREVYQILADQIRELLQLEEEKISGNNPDNNRLGNLRHGLEMASHAASALDITPLPLGGTLKKISTFAEWYMQKINEIGKDATQDQLAEISKKLQEMEGIYVDAETAAPQNMLVAQEAEQKAIKEDKKRTTNLISVIKPPDNDTPEAWNKWAQKMGAQKSNNEFSISLDRIVKIAEINPSEACQMLMKAWIERIRSSDAAIDAITYNQQQDLEQINKSLEIAKREAAAIKEVLNAKQEALEKVCQDKAVKEEELQQANKKLEAVIDPNSHRPLLGQAAIQEKQREEVARLTAELQELQEICSAAEEAVQTVQQSSEQANKNSLHRVKEYLKTKKNYDRFIARATARARADREAFIAAWPKAAVSEPLIVDHAKAKPESPQLKFLKMLEGGIRPAFPWEPGTIIPGVFEEVGLAFLLAIEKVDSLSEKVEQPLLFEEHLERLGRSLLENSMEPHNEKDKREIFSADHQVVQSLRLYEAGIDVLHPSAEEIARFAAREKIDQLDQKISELQANKKEKGIPDYINDSRTSVSGVSFNSSVLSGASAQKLAQADADLKSLKKGNCSSPSDEGDEQLLKESIAG